MQVRRSSVEALELLYHCRHQEHLEASTTEPRPRETILGASGTPWDDGSGSSPKILQFKYIKWCTQWPHKVRLTLSTARKIDGIPYPPSNHDGDQQHRTCSLGFRAYACELEATCRAGEPAPLPCVLPCLQSPQLPAPLAFQTCDEEPSTGRPLPAWPSVPGQHGQHPALVFHGRWIEEQS